MSIYSTESMSRDHHMCAKSPQYFRRCIAECSPIIANFSAMIGDVLPIYRQFIANGRRTFGDPSAKILRAFGAHMVVTWHTFRAINRHSFGVYRFNIANIFREILTNTWIKLPICSILERITRVCSPLRCFLTNEKRYNGYSSGTAWCATCKF